MKKLYTIGRDLQNDIVLEDPTDVISRLHATIRFDGSKMYLIDQSQNGTYVNGMRMSANEEVPVSRKDTVSFANVTNLDWNLLPDPSKARMKKIWFVLCFILSLLLLLWVFLHFTRKQEPVSTEGTKTETTTDKNTQTDGTEDVVDNDTVSVAPTPNEETKEVPVKTGEKTNKTKEEKDDKDDRHESDNDESKTEDDIPLY